MNPDKRCLHESLSRLILPAAALVPFAPLTPFAAAAAADGTEQLPEVIVSAERQDSVLRKTPISVGLVGAQALDGKAIVQLSDLVGAMAGVAVPNGFSNMPQAVGIRGVGTSQPAMAQAVGIYVDDVPLIRGYATALWDLPDIQRIEVLRGPQGTLYGQNSSAGAVKIVSMEPSTDGEAWLSATAGNYRAAEARGYATGAVGSEGAAASLAFSTRHNDGFGYNATRHERINKLDTSQFRAKLRLPIGPDGSAIVAVDGLLDRSDINTLNYPLNHPDSRPRVSYTALDTGQFQRKAGGISLKLTSRLAGGIVFRSITSLRSFDDDPVDSDWGGLEEERFWVGQQVRQTALTQELQWQGRTDQLGWTAGAMLTGDRFSFHRNTRTLPLGASTRTFTEANTRQTTRDMGVYGQARYAWSPATGLTLGLRAYRTTQDAANGFWLTDEARVRTRQVYSAPGLSTSKSGVLPRIGIDHQLSEGTFVYASIAQGEKFGGFNRAAESLASAGVATRPEKITSVEVGSKSRLLDGRLNANVALFYNDYRDYLAALTATLVNGVRVNDTVLVNAGKARIHGADIDVSARLTRQFELTVSLELLRTQFTRFENPTGAPGTDYVGNELPNAPPVSLATTLVWNLPLPGGGLLSSNASFQWTERQFTDVANSTPLRLPRQNYVNLGSTYAVPGRQWSFSLRVRNLQNRAYPLLPVYAPPLGVYTSYWNAPRTVLLTARHDF